jgi:glycosyltransferase involved in cell wall biosynthesis
VKLAVVVQRYGPAIHGGAERHARYLAEHLIHHTDVEVLTTCASSDISWENEFSSGSETINGVQVRRFRVSSPPSASTVTQRTDRVFRQTHSIADELRWLEGQAPISQPLLRHLRKYGETYEFCLFVGYRTCHTYYGAHAVGPRSIVIPHADAEPSIGARIFADVFRGARAILYDCPEEQSLVQGITANQGVPNFVVGAGADVAQNPLPARFRQKRNIRGPFAIYIGRVDDRRCGNLFASFTGYSGARGSGLSLVVVGEGPLAVPAHPRIKHVGALDDTEKFDAMAAAEIVVIPADNQGVSRTALEAWALGKPVLANRSSKAMTGLCVRSNGGLCYAGTDEFTGMLQALEQNRWLNTSLGKNGRQYVRDHYDWRVIERKYHDILAQLRNNPPRTGMSPIAGWMARRRRELSPTAEVVRSVA